MRLLFCLFLFPSSFAFAGTLKGIQLNNKGAESLRKNNIPMAQQSFLKALNKDPNNYFARINLGVTFVYNEELNKALKEFRQPIKMGNASKEVSYVAHFNSGKAYHDLKKTEEALGEYQNSLKFKKDSIQTKANIEMLVQQMQGQGQGGSGDEQENQQNQDQNQQGQGNQKDQKHDQQQDGEKEDDKNKKPKKPQDLSEKDIEKILEELKNQEQKIRALEYGKKSKEDPNGKTW